MSGVDGITSALAEQSTAMASARLKGEFAVKTLKNTLDQQGQAALQLLQSVQVPPSQNGSGQLLDVMA